MATYNTHQKEMLVQFLKNNSEHQFSVEDIATALSNTYQDAPGKSTVYRLIGQLVSNGSVKRFVKGNSRQFLYQIADNEECHHHLHLKCTGCGKLVHMGHALSEQLISNILGENDFSVATDSTTLFGSCRECKIKEG